MEGGIRIDRPNSRRLARGCVWLLAGGFWPRWWSERCSRWAGVRAQRCSGEQIRIGAEGRWLVVPRLPRSEAKASAEVAIARTATRQRANLRGVRRSRTTPRVAPALVCLSD